MWRSNALRNLLIALALLWAVPADAACVAGSCFGIAAGNWGTTGTWSATSGGVTCVCIPANGDAVILDASSGSGTYTQNIASLTVASLDMNGFTGTLAGSTAFSLSGTPLRVGTGTTITFNAAITFSGTSGTTVITSNGKTFPGALTFNGVGGTFQLADALVTTSTTGITVTNGVLDAATNTAAITSSGIINGSNANTRTVSLGGDVTLTGGSAGWSFTTTTGLTFNKNSANIIFAGTTASSRTFSGGALTYNDLTVNANTSNGAITINGANTFSHLNISPPNYVVFQNGVTNTISNAFTWTGTGATAAGSIGIAGSSPGTTSTVAAPASSGGTWVAIRDITFTGNTPVFNSCMDLGHNTLVTCNAPTTSGGGKIIGGSLRLPANDNGVCSDFVGKLPFRWTMKKCG